MNTEYTNENKNAAGRGFKQRGLDFQAPLFAAISEIKPPVNKRLYDCATLAGMFADRTNADNAADSDGGECINGICQMKPDFIEKLRKQRLEKQPGDD